MPCWSMAALSNISERYTRKKLLWRILCCHYGFFTSANRAEWLDAGAAFYINGHCFRYRHCGTAKASVLLFPCSSLKNTAFQIIYALLKKRHHEHHLMLCGIIPIKRQTMITAKAKFCTWFHRQCSNERIIYFDSIEWIYQFRLRNKLFCFNNVL